MSIYGKEALKHVKEPVYELPFSMEEYFDRIKNVRRVMEEKGIDVLLVNDPDNITYLTGNAYPFYMPAQLILPRDEDKGLTLIFPEVDFGVVSDTTWVKDLRTWTQEKEAFPEYTKSILKEKGLHDKVIGYELLSRQLPPSIYLRFRELLPKAKFVDASYIVVDFKYVKSPKEIEYVRKAAKLAEGACKTGIDAIEEGVTERDIAFAINKFLHENGAGYRSGFCLASGPNTASLHHYPTDRKVKKDDLVTMEPVGNYLYYRSSILRTGSLGSPSEKALDLHRVAKEAIEAGMKAMKPGVPMEEIERVTMEIAAEYGYDKYRCHRAGFSFGMKTTRLEHFAHGLMIGEKMELKPGMIFSLEPNFADLENRIGILLGNNILVTETGCEVLYDMPLDLVIK